MTRPGTLRPEALSAFEVSGLVKEYGAAPQPTGGRARALDGVSLRVEEGERVAVIGPSGAGKTTLFRILNGTLPATAGEVRFRGLSLDGLGAAELRRVRRDIGTVYQQHHLVPTLRVVHNVLAGRLGEWSLGRALVSLLVRPLGPARARARAALERVGIGDKLDQRTDRLSGGEQQRVAIARVLAQDPRAVLADEPVASVDPARAEALVRLLVDWTAETRKTLLASLHAVDLALAHFPRIVGLREGRVLFDAAPAAITEAMLRELYGGEAPGTGTGTGTGTDERAVPPHGRRYGCYG